MSSATLPPSVTAAIPDSRGRFGAYGGRYVPETLMYALEQLEEAYASACQDAEFVAEQRKLFHDYIGRPSRLYFAPRLTAKAGGARIYLKREDLNHTGATRSTTPSARPC